MNIKAVVRNEPHICFGLIGCIEALLIECSISLAYGTLELFTPFRWSVQVASLTTAAFAYTVLGTAIGVLAGSLKSSRLTFATTKARKMFGCLIAALGLLSYAWFVYATSLYDPAMLIIGLACALSVAFVGTLIFYWEQILITFPKV